MAIRLVAVDMDGTLLDSRKQHPPDFADWVKRHPEVKMAVASGRQYRTLWDEFPEIADRLMYIAENGGLVFDQGEVLYIDALEPEDVRRTLDVFQGVPGAAIVLCGQRSAWAAENITEEALRNFRIYYHELQSIPDLYEALEKDRMIKMSVYCERDRAVELEPYFRGISPRIRQVVAGKEWIDINKVSVNKGAAIRAVQERLGIDPSECMAFGDYMNDLELLKNCGESYAMANACPEIKAAAKYETLSNDEDGVMTVLRRVLP